MKTTRHWPVADDLRRWKLKLAALCLLTSAVAKLPACAKATEKPTPTPRRRTIPFLELP